MPLDKSKDGPWLAELVANKGSDKQTFQKLKFHQEFVSMKLPPLVVICYAIKDKMLVVEQKSISHK